MNKNSLLLLLGIAIVPFGCTLAPKYDRPAAPVPAQLPTGAAYQPDAPATNAPGAPDRGWRDVFADETLQQVIALALKNNRDMRIAALNVEQARAIYGIQRGARVPVVNATASGSQSQTPADLSSSGEKLTSERYDVNLGSAAWEIDFFGRIRSLKDSAMEAYLASEQAQRGAQILLVSSVANAYLTLAADRENLTLSDQTLTSRQESYNLIKRRHDLGFVTDLDLYRSQAQMEASRGDVARYRQRAAQDENALNLLLGTPTPPELLPNALSDLMPPTEVAAGVSSEALLRRPDVMQAESILRAAHANIGAARASLFPRVSLTAAIGTASKELSGLFKSDSGTWSFAPQLSMPIFDTRSWSALKVTKVQREIARTQYEKTIQIAFKEAADALAVRATIDEQVSSQEAQVNALDNACRLSTTRYEKGIDGYLSVLDAQRSLSASQQVLVFLRLAKYSNRVQLYAVLGGGGDTAVTNPAE